MSLTRTQIAQHRLTTQHLLTPDFRTPAEAVAALGAVQSQDYPGGKWAIGLRSTTITDADVDRAISEGTIVRTHVMRPTWHFVAREDIRWLLDLTGPRVVAQSAGVYRTLGMDAAVVKKSNTSLAKALKNGKLRTRTELLQVLERSGVTVTQPLRRSYLLMRAELDQVICSGPRIGKHFSYALFDERVPAAKPISHDEALYRLAMRYFTTRGPATEYDFSWWSGLTMGDSRRAIEIAGDELASDTLDQRRHWFGPNTVVARKSRKPVAHLLPNYDEYFIGLKDRTAIGEGMRGEGIAPRISVLSGHIFFINGQAFGGWKRLPSKKDVVIGLEPLKRLSRDELSAIERSAERLAAFLGAPVRIREP
jgi:hypothetical protein